MGWKLIKIGYLAITYPIVSASIYMFAIYVSSDAIILVVSIVNTCPITQMLSK